jgi:hypothetical protein
MRSVRQDPDHYAQKWADALHARLSGIPGAILVSALILGASALITHPPALSGTERIASGVGLLTLACVLPPVALRRSLPWYSPGPIYAVLTLVVLGIGSLTWLGSPPPGVPIGLGQEWIARALVISALAMVCYWCGYMVVPRKPIIERVAPPRRLTPPSVLGALYGLGLTFDLLLMNAGAFGYLSVYGASPSVPTWAQWAYVLGLLTNVSLVVTAMHAFGNRSRPHRFLLAALLIVQFALGFLSGYKGQIIWPGLIVLFVYIYYRERFPRWLIIAGLIIILILIPANLLYRFQSTEAGLSGVEPLVNRASSALSLTVSLPLSQRIQTVFQWAIGRSRDIDSIALILQRTPTPNPYLHGRYLILAPAAAVVPRLLWPSKPTYDLGLVFSQQYLGLPAEYHTSTPVTHIGDLFMNFGIPGVFGGMLVVGLLQALLFRWFVRRSDSQAFLVYAIILLAIAANETDLGSTLINTIRNGLLALLIARLLFGRRTRSQANPAVASATIQQDEA